jgi:PIN domain nuclease of toxin-antitoxin system
VRLLLDTHLLLWSLSEPRKIGRDGLALIDRSDVYVSAASIWEISIKAAQGRLTAIPDVVLKGIEPAGFSLLPVQGEHAARVFDLGRHHGDPFDRLLVAQAQLESMTLLTNDEALTAYGNCVQLIN